MTENALEVNGDQVAVGRCSSCEQTVWLTASGACPYGHPASAIAERWLSPPPPTDLPKVLHCKTCGAELYKTIEACPQCGFNPKAGDKHCRVCGAETQSEQVLCVQCGHDLTIARRKAEAASRLVSETGSKSRIVTALLAFTLGLVGVHKFYLGYTSEGVAQLVIYNALILISGGFLAIPLILVTWYEAWCYISISDETFYERYVVGHRGMF